MQIRVTQKQGWGAISIIFCGKMNYLQIEWLQTMTLLFFTILRATNLLLATWEH